MDILFECKSTNSEETYCELYKCLLSRSARRLTVVSIILAVLSFIWWYISRKISLFVGIFLFALVAVHYSMYPQSFAKKKFKKDLEYFAGNIPLSQIQFGDMIYYQDGSLNLTIPYTRVNRVYLLEKSVILMDDRDQAIHFSNTGFVKGNVSELVDFLRKECPQMKLMDQRR